MRKNAMAGLMISPAVWKTRNSILCTRLWRFLVVATLASSSCFSAAAQDGSGQDAQTKPEATKRMPADADPSFEVATVKPSDPDNHGSAIHVEGRRFVIKNHTMNVMLMFAYGIHPKQIVDAPSWFASDRYDVDGVLDVEGQPSLKQMQRIVQKLLAGRFQLKFHPETRELSVYALAVAKDGPKLTKSKGDPNLLGDENDNSHGGQITQTITNMSMTDFALLMQFFTDRPVVDHTGLTGKWDFKWTWTADESRVAPDAANPPPGMFTAIQEELGLKLDPVKAPADVYVIDRIERPSPN
jgi:uncharacterized protein (TIGR03435 family)